MMIDQQEIDILASSLQRLSQGFTDLPPFDSSLDADRIREVMDEVATRMQDNYPYYHPRYAGQMMKPPHPVARIAYMLSLWINPNNHALDGGIASSAMEKEAVAAIATMFGFDRALGHLCGGGTMANMEALWVAGKLHPGKKIVASEQAHYTHSRISEVLGLEFSTVTTDVSGRMDLPALQQLLERDDIGTVVVTLGTTGLGAVDPLADILPLREKYDFRVHVDSAYGGYFHIASELPAGARRAFDQIHQADSIVVDPHKHGLQPYGCGCILFRDSSVGALYKHDSPYTYFSSAELHLGEISLECSRPGAAAVALWATQRLLPMDLNGEFSGLLDRSLQAARKMHQKLQDSGNFRTLLAPELDIVVYAVEARDAVTASERARQVFTAAAGQDLHLALIELPAPLVRHYWPELESNRDTVTCLRSCLMKPEHLDWVDDICEILERVCPADGS
jgi:glutamate/tyrosine decarboxylase-like PLP-dependent enzyme